MSLAQLFNISVGKGDEIKILNKPKCCCGRNQPLTVNCVHHVTLHLLNYYYYYFRISKIIFIHCLCDLIFMMIQITLWNMRITAQAQCLCTVGIYTYWQCILADV